MQNIMISIQEYIENEENRMTWLDKLFMNYPEIKQTSAIAHFHKKTNPPAEVVIRPSLITQIISIIITSFLGLVWIFLLKLLINYTFPFVVICFGFLLVSFFIYLVLRNAFFNKKYIYTILLNKNGINVGNTLIGWADLNETCIMSKREGKRSNSYLILFKKNNTIEKHDLFQFGISDAKLASLIEYYKTQVS